MADHAQNASSTTTSGFVRAGILRGFTAFLSRYPDLDVAKTIAKAGLDPRQFGNPTAVVDARRNAAMLDLLAEGANDPALGLQYAQQLAWGDLGPLGYIVLNSPTIGAALANACRYFKLRGTGGGTTLEVDGAYARISYVMFDQTIVSHAQNTEFVFGTIVRALREALGDTSWGPREVHLRHVRPARTAKHQEIFRSQLEHGQLHDSLVLDAAELRRPMPRADAGLLGILIEHANDLLLHTGSRDPFLDQLKRVVMTSLRSGEVTIEHVALRLGTSARTIQRRLQDTGQSFKDLVAQTRLSLSRRYLEDASMSLTDAAYLLGYSDLSAFSRAFRRWTGQSAREFRRQHARVAIPR